MNCNGTGSIQVREDKKTGKKVYDVWYRWLDVESGKKKQSSKRGFKRKQDAQQFLDEVTGKIKENKFAPSSVLTLEAVANEWFATTIENRLKPNTINWYRVNKDKHIIPYMGQMPMQQITVQMVQALYDQEKKKGLSDTSVYYIHRTLKQIYQYALRKKYIMEDITKDPTLICKQPAKKITKAIATKDIADLITNRIPDHIMAVPIALAGLMGLRRGEVLGLKWSAVDFERKTIVIMEQRTRYDLEGETSTPKTASSQRVLPIPDVVIELLSIQKNKQIALAEQFGIAFNIEAGFVCCYLSKENFGKPYQVNYFSKSISKVLKDNGFEKVTFHELRHSYASNLIHMKIPITTVSKLLGHESPDITLKIYAHIIGTAYLEEFQTINERFNAAVASAKSIENL